jgi:LysR family cys regulon transcriptional activator
MGIATLPEIAFNAKRDPGLTTINARHLFDASISYVWVHRHHYLRGYVTDFVNMLSGTWTRAMIDRAMQAEESADEALAVDPAAGH